MKLTLNHPDISADFLAFLQSVLPREIQTLPVHIIIQETWENARELVPYFPPSYWECVKNGTITGTFAADRSGKGEEFILLYPERFPKNVLWYTAFNFFHESRHVYQRHFLTDIYLYEIDHVYTSDTTQKEYGNQWLEHDANHFAYDMMNRYHEQISTFLGTSEWSCIQMDPAPRHHLESREEWENEYSTNY